ncbi:MAG: hypothetical protein RJA70_2759 [Pseudomonadota bacterium]
MVHFRYELYDAEGELVEETDPEVELSFLFGYAQVADAIERALDGAFAGDCRETRVPAEEAFGPRDPEAILEVDRAEFPPDVQAGDEFEADHESGELVSLTVLEVLEDAVILDANHPLAGQAIRLKLVVDAVRPALSLEIELATEELERRQSGASAVGQAGDFQAGGLLPAARLLRRAPSPGDDPQG